VTWAKDYAKANAELLALTAERDAIERRMEAAAQRMRKADECGRAAMEAEKRAAVEALK
jgi:hypothetical protein